MIPPIVCPECEKPITATDQIEGERHAECALGARIMRQLRGHDLGPLRHLIGPDAEQLARDVPGAARRCGFEVAA